MLSIPGLRPQSRHSHAATSVGKDLFIYGGYHVSGTTGTYLSDMWHFNPATRVWAQVAFSTQNDVNPIPRYGHSMEVAPDQSAIFMFGGFQLRHSTCSRSRELWSLDLTSLAWEEMLPSTDGPDLRYGHGSAVSKRRGLMFIFGGRQLGTCGHVLFNDLWSYSFASNTWSQLSGPGAPLARIQVNMAYDELEDQLIIYGGELASNQDSGSLYQFDVGTHQWRTLHDGALDAPPARHSASAVLLAPGTFVICCGDVGGAEVDDTWKVQLAIRALCTPGQVFNGTGCSECPAGKYDANLETDIDDCLACEEDTYSNAGSTSCAPLLGPWIQALPPPDLTIVRNLVGSFQLSVSTAFLPSHFHGIASVPHYFVDLGPTPDSLQPRTDCSSQWQRSVYNNQHQLIAELTYADFDDKCPLNETQSGDLIQRSGYAALFAVLVGASDLTVAKLVMALQLNFTRTATGVYAGYVATGWRSGFRVGI